MDKAHQSGAGPSNARNVGALVAIWHFAVAAASVVGLVLLAREFWNSEEARLLLQVSAGLVIPLATLYVATGVGILRWRSWGRTWALVLNWINVLAAALMFRKLPGNLAGIVSALASCLVIYWLTMGTTRVRFKGRISVS